MSLRGMEQYDWLRSGFFTGQVYSVAKTSPVDNFKHEWKMAWLLPTWKHFCWGSFRGVKVLGQPQTLGQEMWPSNYSNLRYYLESHFSILSPTPTIASNNLLLGWDYWLTGALFHRSLMRPWKRGTSCCHSRWSEDHDQKNSTSLSKSFGNER